MRTWWNIAIYQSKRDTRFSDELNYILRRLDRNN